MGFWWWRRRRRRRWSWRTTAALGLAALGLAALGLAARGLASLGGGGEEEWEEGEEGGGRGSPLPSLHRNVLWVFQAFCPLPSPWCRPGVTHLLPEGLDSAFGVALDAAATALLPCSASVTVAGDALIANTTQGGPCHGAAGGRPWPTPAQTADLLRSTLEALKEDSS